MKEKVILVDCDGVLLDWVYSFTQWMTRHGYSEVCDNTYDIHVRYGIENGEAKKLVRMFNESASIRKLPPYLDAIKYVKKLHQDHGYIFHAITSLSNDDYAQHLRTKNLIELFGPTVFERYVYLDTGADKDEALLKYKDTGCVWVEDKPENADVGLQLGLDSILMHHSHNIDYKGDALRVYNWKEIYKYIVG
jgi:Predicted phosphatase/phosphohexomutase